MASIDRNNSSGLPATEQWLPARVFPVEVWLLGCYQDDWQDDWRWGNCLWQRFL